MRFIVSGGGTGGHIYPALSIAQALREQGHELLYVGGHDSPEAALAAEYGFDFAPVSTAPLHRRSLKIVADLLKNAKGMKEAKSIIRSFGADGAIGTGGFVTAPVLMAAQKLGIPTMIHEQNAYPGLANRRLSQKTAAVCITFRAASAYFPADAVLHHTGLPVRENILALADGSKKAEAYDYFAVPEEERHIPTLLITGGSQGAASINNAALNGYSALLETGCRIIHLCGKKNYEEMKKKAPEHKRLILLPYLEKMEYAMAVADLAVARAGASFLAEAAVMGLPLILIPYPYATNDHQTANAREFEEAGGACIIKDSCLGGDVFAATAKKLLADKELLCKMSAGSLSLAKSTAALDIAEAAVKMINK